jgi:hypothetical protein
MHDEIWKEYNQARTRYYQAQHSFDNAEPEFIDAAIAELNAAEKHMDSLLRKIKGEKEVAV